MKLFLASLLGLISLATFASSVEERAIAVDSWCAKDRKINVGVYKLDQGCKATLTEKKAVAVEGICRGTLKRRSKDKINYKISFSTKAGNRNLKYLATSKDSLWNVDNDLNPEVSFFQPTWNQYRNQKYLLFINENDTINVTRGNETVVNIKNDDIDLLFIEGNNLMINNETTNASIIVNNHSGTHTLKNVSCDLLL